MKNFIILLLTTFVAFNMQAQCNLLPNGDFELGDTGFASDYTSLPSVVSFPPGSYLLISDNDNAMQCIDIMDHSFCESGAANNNVMLVNGRYGQTANSANVIWETNQSITVEANKNYTFGFAFKKFPDLFYSCSSDYVTLTIQRSVDQGATWSTLSILPNLITSFGECDWLEEKRNIFLGGETDLNIRILLEETGGRSGNAFALDDMFLEELQVTPLQMSLESNIPQDAATPLDVTASIGGSISSFEDLYYLPSACNYSWTVLNVDTGAETIGGTSATSTLPWGTTTDFDGMDLFANVNYKVTLNVDCPGGCYESGSQFRNLNIDITSARLAGINTVKFTTLKDKKELEEFKELMLAVKENANQKDGDDDIIIIFPVTEEEEEGNRTTNNDDIITIWPNPAKNNLSIKFDKKPLGVSIMDMKGAMIYDNRNVNDLQLENIDISKVPAGIYIVKAEFEDGVVSRKIVKNNNSQEIRN